MYCAKCELQLDEDALFCKRCGTAVDAPDATEKIATKKKSIFAPVMFATQEEANRYRIKKGIVVIITLAILCGGLYILSRTLG